MTDREALQRCQQGDNRAFRHLVQRYQRPAMLQALRWMRSQDDAQEAVQACFVKAFERIEQCDAKRPFFPWFRTVLKHHCFKLLERQKRQQPLEKAPEQPRTPQVSDETRLGVHKLLAKLPEKEQALLIAKHVEEKSYAEISQSLGIPSGTVMSRLFAARQKMRLLWEESR